MKNNSQEKNKLESVYQPAQTEAKWYRYWEESGCFSSENNKEGEPFCIVMPPPNVTGQLHMGHALNNAIQDILSRWRRMQGRRVLWLPGTDHAGIATQARVEEHIAKDGLSKYDLGREAFLAKTWEWKERYHGRITKQLRTLGCSCDWDKERFTLDEGCSEAVRQVFVELYNKGLIYRGSYIVNWCSKCQTTISDIEVEHEERAGHLWYLRYPFADGSGFVTVATSRPETLLGDTGVAVHPEDERYRHLLGKELLLPVMNRRIPLLADEYVSPEYGTGAVKVTPAHDPNDYEMGLRHDLPRITVIGRDGKMTEEAGKYAGMDSLECRAKLVEEFAALGLLDHIEGISHAVGECYRCSTTVEPLVSPQWFVRMKPLAQPAIKAVKSGDIRFVPDRFSKIYLGWMENIRDWCISRQLWWGHRIPVWYCGDCGEVICQKNEPEACPRCASRTLEQDPDVLDTWFSSALWPFSTLGWPEETEDLKRFYPTDVLVTARDIIFFWVARMIFSGLEFMREKPFADVFIHGLMLDAQGRKMSKSANNGVDPIDVIEKYGADALRFMLVTGNTPGNDLRFAEERVEAARNFINKLWNACRFAYMNLGDYQPGAQEPALTLADKWILARLNRAAGLCNSNLERYELGEAARALYDFLWDEFCDWYVELAKPRLYQGAPQERHAAQFMLAEVLSQSLRLLHPFIPFVTEELWRHLPGVEASIMLAAYPQAGPQQYAAEEAGMQLVMEIVRAVRNIRMWLGVPLGKKVELVLFARAEAAAIIQECGSYITLLAQASSLSLAAQGEPPAQAGAAHVRGVDIYVPLKGLIDIEKETARLEKELAVCDAELQRLAGKLNNEGFLAKAPPEVVEKERAKLPEYAAKQKSLSERLQMLKR
ncbi:MAG: valine--tRNA ligase [Clostridiales bacterium]|nr:valine--tRNA ligase [Clostridiales bacterium]